MNVVVIQTAFLGDVLLTLPLCQAVKNVFPEAHVTFITTPSAAAMVASVGCIDRVVEFDKRGKHKSLKGQRELAAELSSESKMHVLVAHKSWRTALLLRSLNADYAVAYDDSPARWFADVAVQVPPGLHAAERYLLLLKPLLKVGDKLPTLSESTPVKLQPMHTISDGGESKPHIVLAPGSVWKTKQWPAKHFRALAERLVQDGLRVSVIGDASVAEVASGLTGVTNFAGKTSMQQAAQIVAAASILVANDSAPVHLASLQNVPVVAIFGPTIPEFGFGPFSRNSVVVEQNLTCRPCSDHGTDLCPLGTHECMNTVTVEMVADQIQHILHAHDENRHATTT
jgi:heptosyltransferase-2